MHRRNILLGALGLAAMAPLASVSTALAVEAPGADKFVEGLGNRAVSVLADPQRTNAKIRAEFASLLKDGFDLDTIGRFVLGRYWNTASEPQKAEYQKLFADMVVNVYTQRFSQYAGETFKVTGQRAEGERDTMVTSQIVRPDGPPVNVQWRVRPRQAGLKIIDVLVEGVSMSITQRDDFASVIESNGGRIQALLDVLRKRAAPGNVG
jgi:phospholipid transport system substrate-binding protein